jgi:hypothetical protein
MSQDIEKDSDDEDFRLREEDRAFVSAVLRAYSKKLQLLADEVSCVSGYAGSELIVASTRAMKLAEEINPAVRDKTVRDSHGRGLILGLKY